VSEDQPRDIHEEMRDDVKLILTILNGNGKIGLCAKVSILWKTSLFVISAVVIMVIKGFM